MSITAKGNGYHYVIEVPPQEAALILVALGCARGDSALSEETRARIGAIEDELGAALEGVDSEQQCPFTARAGIAGQLTLVCRLPQGHPGQHLDSYGEPLPGQPDPGTTVTSTVESAPMYRAEDYYRSNCGTGYIWRAVYGMPGVIGEVVQQTDPDYPFAARLTYVPAPPGHRHHGTVNYVPRPRRMVWCDGIGLYHRIAETQCVQQAGENGVILAQEAAELDLIKPCPACLSDTDPTT